MLHNYFKIALRSFFKHRLFSLINLIGLTVGLTICLLIVLFVKDELSYDNFHSKADRLLLFQQFQGASGSAAAFAPLLESEIGQIEETARLVKTKALIGKRDQSYYENNFFFADTTVFDLFDLPLIAGDAKTALTASQSLVLSESMAQKYFPNEDPMGKSLEYGDKGELVISGVMKDLPANSHLQIDFLCPYQTREKLEGYTWSGFWNNQSLTYLLLSPGSTKEAVAAQLPKVIEKTNDPNSMVWKPAVIPLRDIYLKYKLDDQVKAQGGIENVWIFSIIAVFILALACFNYVNLVTARASTRALEVGVRKVLGARKRELLVQFLSESSMLLVMAVLLAVLTVQLVLPGFNQFIDKALTLHSLFNPVDLAVFAGLFGLIALLTGSYPALVLTSFQPVTVLKKAFFGNRNDGSFRRVLVLLQFTVSIIMIVATLVVMNQLFFIQNKDLGYQRDQVLTIAFQGDVTQEQQLRMKREIAALASVRSVSLSSMLPGEGTMINKLVEDFVPSGKDISYDYLHADEDFLKTFDIQLEAGRFFDATSKHEKQQFIVNEAMVDFLEWNDGGIGKEIGYYSYQFNPDGGYAEVPVIGEVIGVISDYHQGNLKTAIKPMLMLYAPGGYGKMAIRIAGGQISNVVETINQLWKSIFPKEPFEYTFLDEAFDQTYAKEIKLGQLFGLFAGLAIFISCLGLLGLVAFAAERRTREIGIRKVLGAGMANLIHILSKDLVRLIPVAASIAIPLAWWVMNRWLERFAYRIEIQWWVFALAAGLAIAIALLTVSIQGVRSALADPVESLKSE